MAKLKGSKDGYTWEEMARSNQASGHNRFSRQQRIKNLTLLMKWCGKKIKELTLEGNQR